MHFSSDIHGSLVEWGHLHIDKNLIWPRLLMNLRINMYTFIVDKLSSVCLLAIGIIFFQKK